MGGGQVTCFSESLQLAPSWQTTPKPQEAFVVAHILRIFK